MLSLEMIIAVMSATLAAALKCKPENIRLKSVFAGILQ